MVLGGPTTAQDARHLLDRPRLELEGDAQVEAVQVSHIGRDAVGVHITPVRPGGGLKTPPGPIGVGAEGPVGGAADALVGDVAPPAAGLHHHRVTDDLLGIHRQALGVDVVAEWAGAVADAKLHQIGVVRPGRRLH